MTDTVRTNIGCDLGKGYIKWYLQSGQGEIQSLHSTGKMVSAFANKSSGGLNVISFNNRHYILGEYAPMGSGFTLRNDESKADELTLAFVLAVLAKENITHADVMVGLPISMVAKEGALLKRLLTGKFEDVLWNDKPITIDINPYIMAEPLGTAIELSVDDRGMIVDKYYKQEVCICDIGFSTVDTLLAYKLVLTPKQKSDNFGTSTIFNKVWQALEPKHGMAKANEKVRIMDSITRNDRSPMYVGGTEVDHEIWGVIDQAKDELARSIVESMKSVLESVRPPITVFTGGGALLIQNELKQYYPWCEIHRNARFSNAVGFYRGLVMHKKERAAATRLEQAVSGDIPVS